MTQATDKPVEKCPTCLVIVDVEELGKNKGQCDGCKIRDTRLFSLRDFQEMYEKTNHRTELWDKLWLIAEERLNNLQQPACGN